LTLASDASKHRGRTVFLAGCAMALAISTHPTAALTLPFFLLYLCLRVSDNRNRGLGLGSSLFLPALLWLAVHGDQSLAAFHQMRTVFKAYLPPPAVFGSAPRFWGAGVDPFRSFNRVGGTVAALFFLAIILTSARIILDRLQSDRRSALAEPGPLRANSQLTLISCCALVSALVGLLFFMEFVGSRVIYVFPVALVGVAAALSHAPSSGFRWAATLAVAGLLVIQPAAAWVYFSHSPGRDPERYAAIVDHAGNCGHILVAAQLWFAFNERGCKPDLIFPYMDGEVPFETSQYMGAYDLIVVARGMPHEDLVMASAASVLKRRTEQCVADECYVEFAK
jgi:hypothetical protein